MEITNAVTVLAGLAQETRLAIYRHLVQAGPDGVRAGIIAQELALPHATLSFHLTHLCHAGLLTSRREGRRIVYSVDFSTMNELVGYLMENCCGGEDPCTTAEISTCSSKRE